MAAKSKLAKTRAANKAARAKAGLKATRDAFRQTLRDAAAKQRAGGNKKGAAATDAARGGLRTP